MTEAEWLTTDDLGPLTEYLVRQALVSRRKLGLFAVACCRLVAHLPHHTDSRKALDAAERYAEGRIQVGTLTRYGVRGRAAFQAEDPSLDNLVAGMAAACAWQVCTAQSWNHVPYRVADTLALEEGIPEETPAFAAARRLHLNRLVVLLRDLVGNPFRTLPARDPAWLDANGGLAARLANSIYEDRRFTELPILADALEDAGCTAATLLDHCRSPGVHTRGCWALDLLLGKR